MVTLEVDPQFHGPTVAEIASTLADIKEDPVRVRWGGTKEEIKLVENDDRAFVVIVPSLVEMSTVAFLFGTPLLLGDKILSEGKDALINRKTYNWKKFTGDNGPTVTKSIVVKLAANAVRQGLRPKLARVASDALLGKVNAADADTLIRTAYV